MKKYLIISLLTIATYTSSGQISIDSIKAIIKHEVAAKRAKGIIVGIVDSLGRRQIVAEGVVSDSDRRLPDSNTLFEIGSITKVFTSLLLADMSLKHQLTIDDPISKYLPKTVRAPIRNGKEISLLSLSTHRSGMPRFPHNVDPRNPDHPYADYTVDRLYEYVSTFEPPFDIDSRWQYSNIAYGLLGTILEKVAQKNYEDLVVERICRPLNMSNTFISLTASEMSNVAIGHAETGTPTAFTDLGAIEAGGALRSNVADLLTFAEANLGLNRTELYPAMQLTHLLRAKKDGNDTYTTMGWTLSNDNGKYHLFKDGGMPGYRSFIGIDTINKIGVIVLANSNNSVSDIGWHLLDSSRKIESYKYPWALLDTMRSTIRIKGVDAAIELFHELKAAKNAFFVFNEAQLNYLGTELRRDNKIKDAIKIFELNITQYPESPSAYESLGETYRRNKNEKAGITYFEKAMKLDPQNLHWAFMLEKLKKKRSG
ncbi:MAG: serine hydrolase [Chitinophagaceae bacterium]|nr:serine hydrolase [Chitinophagaceae bacterium]